MNIFQKHKCNRKLSKIEKHTADTFNQSSIYKLKCNNYPLKYVGQADKNF
jgi:hypothetical protein